MKGKAPMSETNAVSSANAKRGVKAKRLTGPAVGRTGQRNMGQMGRNFKRT